MPVYLARFGLTGPVKLGCSNHIARRLTNIGQKLWDDLHLIWLLDGDFNDEAILHKRFGRFRLRSEWYTFTPEMMGDLGLPDLALSPARTLPPFRWTGRNDVAEARSIAIREWMEANCLFEHALAAKLGCSPTTIAEWLELGLMPQKRFSAQLISLSGGKLAAALRRAGAA